MSVVSVATAVLVEIAEHFHNQNYGNMAFCWSNSKDILRMHYGIWMQFYRLMQWLGIMNLGSTAVTDLTAVTAVTVVTVVTVVKAPL